MDHTIPECFSSLVSIILENDEISKYETMTKKFKEQEDLSYSEHNFKDILECPVCFELIIPPIFQCSHGHLLCSLCKEKVSSCPSCRQSMPDSIRNLALEKLSSSLTFPCKNKTNGCCEKLAYINKFEHESTCKYRHFECPCPGMLCTWTGRITDITAHLIYDHHSIPLMNGEKIIFVATNFKLVAPMEWVALYHHAKNYFLLILEKKQTELNPQNDIFYTFVTILQSREIAKRYMYEITITNGDRILSYKSTPTSIQDDVEEIIKQDKCLCFDAETAKYFGSNGNLSLNIKVYPVSQNAIII